MEGRPPTATVPHLVCGGTGEGVTDIMGRFVVVAMAVAALTAAAAVAHTRVDADAATTDASAAVVDAGVDSQAEVASEASSASEVGTQVRSNRGIANSRAAHVLMGTTAAVRWCRPLRLALGIPPRAAPPVGCGPFTLPVPSRRPDLR